MAVNRENKRESGYRDVVDYLEAQIVSGVLAPGTRIPSLRRLCGKFNISMGTAVRGVEVLAARGKVETRRGSGVYVKSHTAIPAGDGAGPRFRVGAFIADTSALQNSYCAHALRGVMEATLNAGGVVQLHYIPVFYDRPLPDIATISREMDLLILLGEYDWRLKTLDSKCPVVGIEMENIYGGVCSCISVDSRSAAETACDFFHERGCRLVRMVEIPHLPVHWERARHFRALWDGELEVVPYRDPTSVDEIAGLDVSDPEIGYWFSSGTIYQRRALPYREATGRVLAMERHVLSIDGKSLVVPQYEPTNTIGVNWYELGVAAFEEGRRRMENPGSPARRIGIPGRLHLCRSGESKSSCRQSSEEEPVEMAVGFSS